MTQLTLGDQKLEIDIGTGDMSALGLAGERQVSGGLLHHSEEKGGKGKLLLCISKPTISDRESTVAMVISYSSDQQRNKEVYMEIWVGGLP